MRSMNSTTRTGINNAEYKQNQRMRLMDVIRFGSFSLEQEMKRKDTSAEGDYHPNRKKKAAALRGKTEEVRKGQSGVRGDRGEGPLG